MLQLRSPSNQIKQAAFAATAATTAKTPFLENSRVFIAVNDADAAAESNHVYESEISEIAKTAAQAWAVGAPLYWDDSESALTTTATSNTLCGYAIEPAIAAATESGLVYFNSFMGLPTQPA